MNKYIPEIHHRHSIRLQNYDYSQKWLYFITICVENRECLFGEITNSQMKLSNIWIIADIFWHKIKNHTKNIKLHEFIVMPNHIHWIFEIAGDENVVNGYDVYDVMWNGGGENDCNGENDCRGLACKTPTGTETKIKYKNNTKNEYMSKISPKSWTISAIIRSYKSAVSKHSHRLWFAFKWQRNYREHIIRTEQEYLKITEYIINNPLKWEMDKLYKK
jgi:REP element-mobilizing transposase RayT